MEEKTCRVVELEQEVEVMEGELSAAQQAAKQAPSRTMKALVERLRNQLAMKEKQHRVSSPRCKATNPKLFYRRQLQKAFTEFSSCATVI